MERSKDGRITPGEPDQVRQALDSGATGRQAHRATETLGRAGSPDRDSAMVRDFVADADPELSAVAVHVLVDVWDLGEQHRADMMRLIR